MNFCFGFHYNMFLSLRFVLRSISFGNFSSVPFAIRFSHSCTQLPLTGLWPESRWLKLLEKKHLFDPEKKFYSWIFAIASNMCKTAYRHHGKTVSLHTQVIERGVLSENELEKSLFLKALENSIDNLEHHHKSVFILRYLEHFSLNEIAEITESSLGTVKSRLFYATRKITEELKPYDPSFETTLFKLI